MAKPSKFAHVVYSTRRFDEMIDWYQNVFEATVVYQIRRSLSLPTTTNIIVSRSPICQCLRLTALRARGATMRV
jgi:hypothetical protein